MEVLLIFIAFMILVFFFMFFYIKNLIQSLKNKDLYIRNIREYAEYYKDIVYRFQNRNIVLDENAIQVLLTETKDFTDFLSEIEKSSSELGFEKTNE